MTARRHTAAEQLREERQRGVDEAAQERGPAMPAASRRTAPGFVHATHPDTGIDVTFVPGETLPTWASDKLAPDVVADPATGAIELG